MRNKTTNVLISLCLAIVPFVIDALAQTPAPSGMVAWFTGDGDAHDQLGLNNGTLLPGAKIAIAKVGQGFYFDGGPSSYVSVPSSASLDVGAAGNGLTIETWLKTSDLDTSHPIVEWSANSGAAGSIGPNFYLSGNSLYANLIDTGGNAHVLQSSAFVLTLGATQHIALTYNQITGRASIYINGNALNLTGGTNPFIGIFTPATNRDLYLGARVSNEFGNAGFRYKGNMDEVSIYGRALSTTEIQAIYQAGSPGKTKGVTTPLGSGVAVRTGDQTLTFPTVSSAGITSSYSVDPQSINLPAYYKPLAYNISSTASYAGSIQACFTLTALAPLINSVHIFHNEGGAYLDRTSSINAPAATACATVSGLGQFVVAADTASASAGLVSWWTGDGDAHDQQNVNNGQLQSGADIGFGKVDQAFRFSANAQNVSIPDTPALRPQSLTIKGWVKSTNTAGLAHIFAKAVGTADQDSYVVFQNNNQINAGICNLSNCTFVSSPIFSVNVWHHVAFTFDDPGIGMTKTLSLYVDGNAVAGTTTSLAPAYDSHAALIGADSAFETIAASWHGSIDELAIYNRALLPGEIQAVYSSGLNGELKTVPTSSGSSIAVRTSDETLTFSSISAAGITASYSLDPAGLGTSSGYYKFLAYNVSTTAVYSGNIQVCFLAPALSVYFSGLRVLHREGSVFVDRTSSMDSGNKIICATVSSLGQFALASDYILPAPAGLISWWTGDGSARDQLNINNGTLQGGRYTLGVADQGFYFRNTPKSVLIPDSPSLRPQSLTIEAWVNANNFDSIGHILAKTKGTGDLNSYVVWQESGSIRGAIGDGSNFVQITAPVFAIKSWHHVAFTFSDPGIGMTKTLTLYVDGSAVATGTTSVAIAYDTHAVLIGADYSNESINYSWQGAIDEVALYDRPLSPTEIQNIYFGGLHGKIKPVVTPTGTHVLVGTGGESLTFTDVSGSGTTSSVSLDPSSFSQLANYYRLLAYNISTTATFSGNVEACFGLPGVSPDAYSLRIFHLEAGTLFDRTTSTDPGTNTVCATVNTLGQFVVAMDKVKPGQIYYSRPAPNTDADGTIWTIYPNGTDDHGITTGVRPRLSPDGKSMIFKRKPFPTSDANLMYGLWIRNLETGIETELFRSGAHIVGFDFSSDGSQIFFDFECKIFRMNLDGSNVVQLYQSGDCSSDAPAIRASDGLVVFQEFGNFYTMNPDGSNVQIVPNTRPIPGQYNDASWSKDGLYFSFTHVAGSSNGVYSNDSVYKIKPDGTGLLLLKTLSGSDRFGAGEAWSQDGAALYIPGIVGGVSGIYAVATDGSGTMSRAFDPDVSPDLIAAGSNVDFIGGLGGPLGPSAAAVSIGGRVTTSNGLGIRNVSVNITDAFGTSSSTITSPFGYYRFDNIPAGSSYVITVRSKRFRFENPSRLITVFEAIDDLDFVALPAFPENTPEKN